MKKVLYIEGTTCQENGSLRKSFYLLLNKSLGKNMPRIIMGDGKTQAVDKFHTTPVKDDEKRFLLVDSDEPCTNKQSLVDGLNKQRIPEQRKVTATVDNTFFMIQEAETWIMSQPNVLKQQRIKTELLPKRPLKDVSDPSDVLADIYRKSGKEYHKVRDFIKLFPYLDAEKLEEFSSEYKALVNALK